MFALSVSISAIAWPRLTSSPSATSHFMKWLVAEGDEVKRGQAIAEIETDKANMTYEVDTDGTISELVASEGDTLAIGEVIARIGEGNGKPQAETKEEEPKQEEEDEEPQGEEPEDEPEPEQEPEPRETSNG